MDAGLRLRLPLHDRTPRKKKSCSENLDRFIPNRSAMDFDFAHFMLTGGKVEEESPASCSPSKEAYRKQLAEIFNMNRTRILAFKNKPPPSADTVQESVSSVHQSKPTKRRRCIPQCPWQFGISVGCLWSINVLPIDEEMGPVTSVTPGGRHIAVGLNYSHVQLWDSAALKLLTTLRGGHRLRVGLLDWNDQILTTGGMDSLIVINDVRIRSHIVGTYRDTIKWFVG